MAKCKWLFALLAITALFLLSSGFAAGEIFCDEQPAFAECVCRKITSVDAYGFPSTWNALPDIQPVSDWFNMYCTGLENRMQQQRVALQLLKPECVESREIRETRQVVVDYCAKCPGPKVVGQWVVRQCIGSKTLWQRRIIAYYFLPDVVECSEGQWIELSVTAEGPCSDGKVVVLQPGDLPPVDQQPVPVDALLAEPVVLVLTALSSIAIVLAVFVLWKVFR